MGHTKTHKSRRTKTKAAASCAADATMSPTKPHESREKKGKDEASSNAKVSSSAKKHTSKCTEDDFVAQKGRTLRQQRAKKKQKRTMAMEDDTPGAHSVTPSTRGASATDRQENGATSLSRLSSGNSPIRSENPSPVVEQKEASVLVADVVLTREIDDVVAENERLNQRLEEIDQRLAGVVPAERVVVDAGSIPAIRNVTIPFGEATDGTEPDNQTKMFTTKDKVVTCPRIGRRSIWICVLLAIIATVAVAIGVTLAGKNKKSDTPEKTVIPTVDCNQAIASKLQGHLLERGDEYTCSCSDEADDIMSCIFPFEEKCYDRTCGAGWTCSANDPVGSTVTVCEIPVIEDIWVAYPNMTFTRTTRRDHRTYTKGVKNIDTRTAEIHLNSEEGGDETCTYIVDAVECTNCAICNPEDDEIQVVADCTNIVPGAVADCESGGMMYFLLELSTEAG